MILDKSAGAVNARKYPAQCRCIRVFVRELESITKTKGHSSLCPLLEWSGKRQLPGIVANRARASAADEKFGLLSAAVSSSLASERRPIL